MTLYESPPDIDEPDLAERLRQWRESIEEELKPNGATNGATNGKQPAGKIIKTSGEFVADYVPPDYLIDGLLQRQFIYSFTGQTGSGKTAVMLTLTFCIASGVPIGNREVQPGRVIYFAGENPDDVRQRWIAMAEHFGFDIETIDVHFIDGVVDLAQLEDRIRQEIEEAGPATAIVIDTAAAYFLGDDENSNPAMGAYARQLRRFTKMPGGPTVIVNCHPTKGAGPDNLVPRGGGAFLAEVDGNLTCARSENIVVHWQRKFRGAEFEPLNFETKRGTAKRLKDRRGRQIYTVYAIQLSESDVANRASQDEADENAVLSFMLKTRPPPSIADIAEHMKFFAIDGKLERWSQRVLIRLRKEGLVVNERGESFRLTKKGEEQAAKETVAPKPSDPSELILWMLKNAHPEPLSQRGLAAELGAKKQDMGVWLGPLENAGKIELTTNSAEPPFWRLVEEPNG